MIAAFRRRVLRRARPQPDDSGLAMIYLLSFMIFVSLVSAAALANLATEIRQAQFARKHEQTLNTAMAGLQAGLNRIRASTDPVAGTGTISSLPCQGTNRGTLAGSIDVPGNYTYSTDIYYLTTDPGRMTQAQVTAAALACPLTTLPSYAYLVSAGTQPALSDASASLGNRALHAVYNFSTGATSNYGGYIQTRNSLCWDAGAAPAVGSLITLQSCQALGTPSQLWYYRRDLTIQWMGDPAANLCVDYRGTAASPSSLPVTLQTCLGSGIAGTAYDSLNQRYPVAGQQYQEFVLGNWLQPVSASGDASNAYAAASYTPGTGLYEQFKAGDLVVMYPVGQYTTTSYLTLSPSVGAGGTAGVTNGLPSMSEQLVNLAYSADCVDVAGSYPPNGLIHYPCHQAPDPAKVGGNQRFQYGGTSTSSGPLSTVRTDDTSGWSNYAKVCAQSNGSTSVALVSCVSGQANQQWQFTGYRNGDPTGSYLIKDYSGQCVTATGGYSFQLQSCNGSSAQKWNAPPTVLPSLLNNLEEN